MILIAVLIILQNNKVTKRLLQLVGVTAMFIASKYEEMYPPEIGDFAFVTDHTYTNLQIRQMEMKILRSLDFNLGRPLPLHFLRRASKIGEVKLLQKLTAQNGLLASVQLGMQVNKNSWGGDRATNEEEETTCNWILNESFKLKVRQAVRLRLQS